MVLTGVSDRIRARVHLQYFTATGSQGVYRDVGW